MTPALVDLRPTSRRPGREPGPRGKLTALSGSVLGRRFVVHGTTELGRSSGCTIVLDDSEVSRTHARVEVVDGTFVVVDCGSRNGTFVNGERVERATLAFGDKLRVGGTTFVFTRHDLVEEERIQRHRLETLGRMCVGVVHDLNNALCVVSSSVAYLREVDGRDGSNDSNECLADIAAASDQAAQLARQLVSFARGAPATPVPVDVAALCSDVLKLARRTFPQSINLAARLEPGLVVVAEPTQLHQILMNLCVNARDAILATNRPGAILVTAGRRSARSGGTQAVYISVQDDGAGIDEETRERLFEPFFSTKAEGNGFGMGLATVSDLVMQLGGHIELESAVGVGSTFTIELPEVPLRVVPSSSGRSSALQTVREEGRRSRGEHALVVDDDAGVRRSFSRVLRQAGYVVSDAEDGLAALEFLGQTARAVDVVLLDLDMPRMGGEEALGQIKRKHPHIPVIIVSAHTASDVLASVRGRGAHAMIAKPCGPEELLSYVGRALEAKASPFFEETTLSGNR